MAHSSDNNNEQKQEQAVDLEQLFNGSRVRYFWIIFRARLGMLVKINMMLALFALPALAIVWIFSTIRNNILGLQPFSSNLGIGFFPIFDAATRSNWYLFLQNFYTLIGITASLPIFIIGLCGAFYTVKFVARGQVVPIIRTFFIGIKKCFLPFLIVMPFIAGLFFGISAGIIGFEYFWQDLAVVKVLLILLCCLVAFALVIMLIFYATMSVTYKLNPFRIIVNSIKMAFNPKILWRHLVVLVITAIPIVGAVLLLNVPFGMIIVLVPALLLGVVYILLLWTIYADWVYRFVSAPTVAKKEAAQKIVKIKNSDIIEVDSSEVIVEEKTQEQQIQDGFEVEDWNDLENEETVEGKKQKENHNKKSGNKKYSFKK